MEKISGILPANSRVTTVDIKSSGHMRGGMPTFGRPVGVTAVAEKQAALAEKAKQMDAAAKLPAYTPDVAMSRHKEQMEMRVKPQVTQDPKAQIVQNMADQFL